MFNTYNRLVNVLLIVWFGSEIWQTSAVRHCPFTIEKNQNYWCSFVFSCDRLDDLARRVGNICCFLYSLLIVITWDIKAVTVAVVPFSSFIRLFSTTFQLRLPWKILPAKTGRFEATCYQSCFPSCLTNLRLVFFTYKSNID